MLRFGLALTAVVALASPAWAQTTNVRVQLEPAAQSLAGGLGLSVAELERQIGDQIAALYGVSDLAEFLRLSANAQSMVNKGVGVDYASNPTGFLMGLSVSGAFDAGDADVQDIENLDLVNFDRAVPIGVGAQISFMIGYNFTKAGVPGLTLFLNGLAFPLQYEEYQADFRNFGFHAQYKLFGVRGNKAAGWGGLDLTSGIQFSETVLEIDDAINRGLSLVGGTGSAVIDSITEATDNTLELSQTAWTVPLEVTTNVRFLYIVSLFGGFGVDFQFGDAKLNADATAGLESDGTRIGSVAIEASDEAGPTPVLFRFLTGLQLNFGPIKVFGQINFLTENLTWGGAAGIRAVF